MGSEGGVYDVSSLFFLSSQLKISLFSFRTCVQHIVILSAWWKYQLSRCLSLSLFVMFPSFHSPLVHKLTLLAHSNDGIFRVRSSELIVYIKSVLLLLLLYTSLFHRYTAEDRQT